MKEINKFDIFEIITKSVGRIYKNDNNKVEIVLPFKYFNYDRISQLHYLDYRQFHNRLVKINNYHFTAHEVKGRIKKHFEQFNECIDVVLEVFITEDKLMSCNNDNEILENIEIVAHIKFNDEIVEDKFIHDAMLDFAFIIKDKKYFNEVSKRKFKDKV